VNSKFASFAEEVAATFPKQGFSVRRPPSLQPLIDDAALFERGLPKDVGSWFELLGGDRLVEGEGVHGFTPMSLDAALDWRRAVRLGAVTLEDAFVGEAFVPILIDRVGTVVFAFLPLAEFGTCEYAEYFAKGFDSEEMISMNSGIGLFYMFFPQKRGVLSRLPVVLGEIWEEEP
jgi:hypothetical protein